MVPPEHHETHLGPRLPTLFPYRPFLMQLPTLGLDRTLLESVTAPLEKLPDETTAEQIRAGDVIGIVDRALKGEVSSSLPWDF